MTVDGLLYDLTRADDAVLSIDGPDMYATGWAAGLDATTPAAVPRHRPGCRLTDLDLQDACACQPPL